MLLLFRNYLPETGAYLEDGLATHAARVVDGLHHEVGRPEPLAPRAGMHAVPLPEVVAHVAPRVAQVQRAVAAAGDLLSKFREIFGRKVALRPNDRLGFGLGGFFCVGDLEQTLPVHVWPPNNSSSEGNGNNYQIFQ